MGLSLAEELDKIGYLSVNKLASYLKQYHALFSVSYPVLLRMVERGQIRSVKVGSHYRVTKDSILYYLEHGTIDVGGSKSLSSTDLKHVATHPDGIPIWLDEPLPDVSRLPKSNYGSDT